MDEKPVEATPPREKKSGTSVNRIIVISVTSLLVIVLIVMGVLYGQEVGKLNRANTQIAGLQGDVASLQTQLAAEKTKVANLEAELTTTKARVTSLEKELATAKDNIASLQAELTTTKAKVTSLEADLSTANAKVASTQASLDKAKGDLAKAQSDLTTAAAIIASQGAELKKVKDPRHFDSLAELTGWLQKDDTNTNPAYAALTNAAKVYVLQVKALREGYILPVWFEDSDNDGYIEYTGNMAYIGTSIYYVWVGDDSVELYGIGAPSIPPHPLPLP